MWTAAPLMWLRALVGALLLTSIRACSLLSFWRRLAPRNGLEGSEAEGGDGRWRSRRPTNIHRYRLPENQRSKALVDAPCTRRHKSFVSSLVRRAASAHARGHPITPIRLNPPKRRRRKRSTRQLPAPFRGIPGPPRRHQTLARFARAREGEPMQNKLFLV